MNVCIPVVEECGLESRVSPHFGSAPSFLVVDTETKAFHQVVNTDAQHEHGHCAPVALFAGERIDAFVVGGIGGGALGRLLSTGAKVYRACPGTAAAMVEAIGKHALSEVTPAGACHGHSHPE
jgi:predicted Fe-Mo cluster-binding NifX family protein